MSDLKVIDLLWQRRATRAISDEKLPAETVEQIIEAARLTPSCFNKQPWRFYFLEGPRKRGAEKAFTGGNVAWAPRAPLIVVGYTVSDSSCPVPEGDGYYRRFDLGMATMNIMLAATELGLVARPMAGFDPEVLRKKLDFDDGDEITVMIAIGYPGESEEHVPDVYKGIEESPRERHPAEKIVRR